MTGSYNSRAGEENSEVSLTVSPKQRRKRKELQAGCIYKHQKTKGYYLKIRWPGDKKISYTPLKTKNSRSATKQKSVALAIARRLIAEKYDNHTDPQKKMTYWLEEFEAYNLHTASKNMPDTTAASSRP